MIVVEDEVQEPLPIPSRSIATVPSRTLRDDDLGEVGAANEAPVNLPESENKYHHELGITVESIYDIQSDCKYYFYYNYNVLNYFFRGYKVCKVFILASQQWLPKQRLFGQICRCFIYAPSVLYVWYVQCTPYTTRLKLSFSPACLSSDHSIQTAYYAFSN